MHVLMISFDHTMVAQKGNIPGDTQERHLKYAAALQQAYPNGQLTILVKAPLSTSSRPVQLSDALTIYPVPCRRLEFLLKARQVAYALCDKRQIDLLTTQSPFDDGLLGVWLKRQTGIPLHVQMRSSFLDLPFWIKERPVIYRIFNRLGKWVSHRADTIRVVSHGEKQRLEERFPYLQGKVFVLHPLVNVERFSQPLQHEKQAQVQHILQQHDMQDRPFLLFVGRLALQKNLPTLLQAFALACRKIRNTALVIAGDGDLREGLQQLARQLQVNANILWLGNVSLQNLRGWYEAARGFVLPSFHEGVPKVLLESYLIGTPVIAAPFVSAKELIQHGETGFVTQAFTDSNELAENMMKFLSAPDLALDMGKKGRAYILQYLLPEDVYMERLIEMWEITADV